MMRICSNSAAASWCPYPSFPSMTPSSLPAGGKFGSASTSMVSAACNCPKNSKVLLFLAKCSCCTSVNASNEKSIIELTALWIDSSKRCHAQCGFSWWLHLKKHNAVGCSATIIESNQIKPKQVTVKSNGIGIGLPQLPLKFPHNWLDMPDQIAKQSALRWTLRHCHRQRRLGRRRSCSAASSTSTTPFRRCSWQGRQSPLNGPSPFKRSVLLSQSRNHVYKVGQTQKADIEATTKASVWLELHRWTLWQLQDSSTTLGTPPQKASGPCHWNIESLSLSSKQCNYAACLSQPETRLAGPTNDSNDQDQNQTTVTYITKSPMSND